MNTHAIEVGGLGESAAALSAGAAHALHCSANDSETMRLINRSSAQVRTHGTNGALAPQSSTEILGFPLVYCVRINSGSLQARSFCALVSFAPSSKD